jgi:TonB family protein
MLEAVFGLRSRDSNSGLVEKGIQPMFRACLIPLLILTASFVLGVSSAPSPRSSAFGRRDGEISKKLIRSSEFVDVRRISSRGDCRDIQPPQALTTPDPVFVSNNGKVKVSFIVGVDGRVHSPLILESAGLAGDRHVLDTVRRWKYRPATCNGVPTETEGKVEFSSQ